MLKTSTIKRHLDIKTARASVDQQLIELEVRAVGLLEHETGLSLTAEEPRVEELSSNELTALYLPGEIVGTVDASNPIVKVRGSVSVDWADVTALVLDTDFSVFFDRTRRASGLYRRGTTWPTGVGLVQVSANLGYEEGGTKEPPPEIAIAVLDLAAYLFRQRVEKRQVDDPDEDAISQWPASARTFIESTVPWDTSSANVKVKALG